MKHGSVCLFFFLFVLSTTFSQDITRFYDPYATQREVKAFDQLSVSGPIRVILKQGTASGVAVSSENASVRDGVQTNVKNGMLFVQFNTGPHLIMKGNANVIVYVSVKNLDSIFLSRASVMVVDGQLKSEKLGIAVSGASTLKAELQLKNLIIHQSGATDVQLKGATENIEVRLSGASDLKAFQLFSNNCYAEISGASDMQITVSQKLQAKVSGASDFRYRGNPAVKDVQSNGASLVKKLID